MRIKYIKQLRYKLLDRWLRYRMNTFTNTTPIGVTGSCGKTSTTHFLDSILTEHFSVFTGIDYNGHKWVRKNLKKVKAHHRFFIQEIGAAGINTIKPAVELLQPSIGIVTNIGQDHFSAFRTLESTTTEKQHLISSLPPNGVAVLNFDDPNVMSMADSTAAKTLTYGTSEGSDIRATNISHTWPQRLSLYIEFQNEQDFLQTDLFGNIFTISLLAAIAGGIACGLTLQQSLVPLNRITSFERRLAINKTKNGSWIIDDAYKASYWSVDKVLSQLKECSAPRKTVVIGSFSDTPGSDSPKYRATAKKCITFCDRVIFVGEKASYVKKIITDENNHKLFAFDNLQEAHRFLRSTATKDEVILLKSRQKEHLERLIFLDQEDISCWKEHCSFTVTCDKCEKSGIDTNS